MPDLGLNAVGQEDLKALFDGKAIFDFPKPVAMIKRLMKIASVNATDIVLDFFSGSGTTAQAVLETNSEDETERQFILVQLPVAPLQGSLASELGYKSISQITKERIRRVSKKLKVEGAAGDLGFRVLKLAKSNVVRWRGDKATSESLDDLIAQMQSTLVPGWKVEDVLTELMLLEGYPLDSSKTQSPDFDSNLVYTVTHPDKQTRLLVCLDDALEEATVEQLTSLPDLERKTFDFICLDAALTDQLKARLADKLRVKTI